MRLVWVEWNKRVPVKISKSNSTSAGLRHAAVVLTQLRYGRSLRCEMELPAEKQELTQMYNIPSSTESVWRQTHFCKIISSEAVPHTLGEIWTISMPKDLLRLLSQWSWLGCWPAVGEGCSSAQSATPASPLQGHHTPHYQPWPGSSFTGHMTPV